MATFTVNIATDAVDGNYGQLSLREAVNLANSSIASDTIVFASAIEGQTLVLAGGELLLNRDVTIDGDLNNDGTGVAISGNDSQRIFRIVGNSTDVVMNNLTLTNGYTVSSAGQLGGAAILMERGSLLLSECIIENNHGAGYDFGGAIFAGSARSLTILDSYVRNNSTNNAGGAVYQVGGGELNIVNSVFSENQGNGGGAISSGKDVILTVRGSEFTQNIGSGGSAIFVRDGTLFFENSTAFANGTTNNFFPTSGGAFELFYSHATIANSVIHSNRAGIGGAIDTLSSDLLVTNSTIANNIGFANYLFSRGGAINAYRGGTIILNNTTITGNSTQGVGSVPSYGGAVSLGDGAKLEVMNSIVAGNFANGAVASDDNIFGNISVSNGHNIFGSNVAGNNPGDRENVAPGAIFANIDPNTGGGQFSGSVVPLLNSVNNPALSGADPLAASATGQNGTTARPQPAGSLPEIGSIEINQPVSTTASSRNDVLTGTNSANTIDAQAGNDYVKGQGGNDTLRGGEGSDLLEGGAGNDKLYGDSGIDLVFYGGSTKVTVDLSLAADKAKRGGETDSLFNIEGAIASSAADVFKGNEFNNYFQGGLGKDTARGGAGRDLYDFNTTSDSKVGSTARDVITDFVHLTDDIDLLGLDANTAIAGDQSFRWVGTAPLTGPAQVGYFTSSGNTIIRGSNDADAASEFEIQLNGSVALSAQDFYL